MHTTNYFNTFIEVADDCMALTGEVPPEKEGAPSVASIHFRKLNESSYKYTSDDVIFLTHALRKGIAKERWPAERKQLFVKGQACMRCSPLGKRYGWGIHFDEKGKMAIYAVGSDEYLLLSKDKSLRHLKAVRSRKQEIR